MKNLILGLLLFSGVANAGKIQDADFKTLAQITGAGGTTSELENTNKIYDPITGLQLSAAFSGSIINSLIQETKVSCTADLSGILPPANGGSGLASPTANAVLLTNGASAYQTVAPCTSGYVLMSNGTTWACTVLPAAGTGNLSAEFRLENAVVPYTNIGGGHYQASTQSLTTVNLGEFNCGTSGSTTIRVNQYRNSATATNTATASIAASIDSGGPCTSAASLSGTLSLLAGDLITVDVTAVAGGSPEGLSIEY